LTVLVFGQKVKDQGHSVTSYTRNTIFRVDVSDVHWCTDYLQAGRGLQSSGLSCQVLTVSLVEQ